MDGVSGAERQLYILSLLSQNTRGYTLQEIIDSLAHVGIEATRRMVLRDMDSISRNFYVYEEKQRGVTVYKADKYALSGMTFTMPQIISLYYVKETLKADRPDGIAKEASDIIDSILGQMPSLSRAALSGIEQMIKVVPLSVGERDIDAAVLDDVRKAAGECRSIEVTYASFSTGKTQKRVFDPYILEVREGRWHAIGHCHLRGSVRDLRISRMRGVAFTKDRFAVPAGFYEHYRRTRFDKMAGEDVHDIAVRFTGDTARLVAEYHADKADKIVPEDGGILFYKKAALTPDLIQWLLSFGAEARVQGPPQLAQAVRGEAERVAALYGAGQ